MLSLPRAHVNPRYVGGQKGHAQRNHDAGAAIACMLQESKPFFQPRSPGKLRPLKAQEIEEAGHLRPTPTPGAQLPEPDSTSLQWFLREDRL